MLRIPTNDATTKTSKNNRFNKYTNYLHAHHTFTYISSPFLHEYDVKIPHFAFYGERKQATTRSYMRFAISHNAPYLLPAHPHPPAPPKKMYIYIAYALFSISLGTALIPKRNEKQRLCKLLVGK